MQNASVTSVPPVVAVQSLSKTFKDFWLRTRAKAVDNVTFNVNPGEIFGLLGPNGSGKSTTIKIMLGLLKQTSGRVAVFGRSPTDVDSKKRIGYLPEESYLYPFLNAEETLDYYAKLFQLDHRVRSRRISELLEMVGLNAVKFRPVREYSKGMQRRIGLAQALINDPDLLILDEPTTGLDPIGTRQVKDLIIELGRRKKTIVLSSHILADVEDCVDRMVILYGGRIREEGTCDEILSANDRAVIETDPLDQDTIAAIDKLIRERSGGRHSINKVSKGRQKLEEKFIKMVEAAVAEKAETSGARHGGATAGFLRSGDASDAPKGDALIADLVQRSQRDERDLSQLAGAAREAANAAASSAAARTQPDAGVIRDLVQGQTESWPPAQPTRSGTSPAPTTGKPASQSTPPPPASNVDLSAINRLTDTGEP
jgi:ABC-2 type transport system ATP-binding protein